MGEKQMKEKKMRDQNGAYNATIPIYSGAIFLSHTNRAQYQKCMW